MLETAGEIVSQDSDTEQAYLAFICKRLKLNFRKLSVEERKWLKRLRKIRLAEESKTAERTKIKMPERRFWFFRTTIQAFCLVIEKVQLIIAYCQSLSNRVVKIRQAQR